MILKNACVYNADFEPVITDIEIENGIIKSIGKTDKDGEDYTGLTVLPGFIDIHIHGTRLADSSS
ncbi:MAG: N-acetylglucosamine-6-phosphate deacetylase, partial [Clostridia bacterium]|nr:N-acetylglucosamine-6-phosphate deacetylase [Clostridia bacterium]